MNALLMHQYKVGKVPVSQLLEVIRQKDELGKIRHDDGICFMSFLLYAMARHNQSLLRISWLNIPSEASKFLSLNSMNL